MPSIRVLRLIPRPRPIRWDYRNGWHYWLTQWRAWVFSAVVLALALADLIGGKPTDGHWWLWAILFVSGLSGVLMPLLTWKLWVGPVIAQRRAQTAHVQSLIAALDQELKNPTLASWERRSLELRRDMLCEELEIVSAPRTLPEPSR